eukprot:4554231-Pyramimonas_sp.AAC.1
MGRLQASQGDAPARFSKTEVRTPKCKLFVGISWEFIRHCNGNSSCRLWSLLRSCRHTMNCTTSAGLVANTCCT